MRNKILATIGSLGAVLMLAWLVTVQIHGQQGGTQSGSTSQYNPPKTAWGDPDLQGQWNSQTTTPLERPSALADKDTLTEEEAENREEANLKDRPARPGDPGTYNAFWFDPGNALTRTSLVIDPPDGRVPAYTPEAEQRLAAQRADRATRGAADSYADVPIWSRCITRGWNGIGSNYSSNTQIFQSPGYVVVLQELIHEPRIIPLDGRDGLPAQVKQWLGVSRGRWEGNTLVVETRNFDPRSSYRGSSPELLLVERFTRKAADEIDYQFTMKDPTTYVREWTVARPMHLETGNITIFEYACHEGNYAMEGILAGARLQEKNAPRPRR